MVLTLRQIVFCSCNSGKKHSTPIASDILLGLFFMV